MERKKYYIWVIGCQMNISDSERVVRILEDLGYRKTEKEDSADLIMVLACSVRQSAVDRIYGRAKCWRKLKIKNEKLKIILSGCVLPADKPKMERIFDIIFDIKNLDKLPQILDKLTVNTSTPLSAGSKQFTEDKNKDYFSVHPKYESKFQAFVPIMTGCDNFCSYCAVPLTKGREKSRPEKEILKEVEGLVKKGYKEITLLGQNVNSYGVKVKSKKEKVKNKSKNQFVELLEKINKIPGDFWIRFITSNPQDMSDKLIKAVKNLDKVTEYIHLPVQAGNNEILKKMNRKYTKEHYLKLVSKIRKEIPASLAGGPNVSISTDTIVGFPSETRKQFEDTLDLYKKVKFDMAYIAQYSPRPGTAASRMKDDVPREGKRKREKELTEILKKTALKNNKKYLGKTVEVLAEKKEKKYLFGRTRTFKSVQFEGNKNLIGQFVKVKITSATPWAMKGKIIK